MAQAIKEYKIPEPSVISGPEDFKKINNSEPAVYVFRIAKADSEKALGMYRQFRDDHHATDGQKGKYNLTAIANDAKPSEVFYVGKVRLNLHGRMRNHWQSNSPRTGALHLCRWTKGEIKFKTEIYPLPERFPLLADVFENEFKLQLKPAVGSRT